MSSVEDAQRAARARAYLDSDPEVLAAVRATKAHQAMLSLVSTDVRDHYAAEILCAARAVLDARTAASRTEGSDPEPGSIAATLWMSELTDDERADLPAAYHRPFFDSLSNPPAWICEACHGEDWTTAWPCPAVDCRDGGLGLADAMGLGCSR